MTAIAEVNRLFIKAYEGSDPVRDVTFWHLPGQEPLACIRGTWLRGIANECTTVNKATVGLTFCGAQPDTVLYVVRQCYNQAKRTRSTSRARIEKALISLREHISLWLWETSSTQLKPRSDWLATYALTKVDNTVLFRLNGASRGLSLVLLVDWVPTSPLVAQVELYAHPLKIFAQVRLDDFTLDVVDCTEEDLESTDICRYTCGIGAFGFLDHRSFPPSFPMIPLEQALNHHMMPASSLSIS